MIIFSHPINNLRYFFHIAYLGTHYHGWQKHPDGLSVQEVLENCLSRVLKQPAYITGCGRTDAQVHASQFFFHLEADAPLDDEVQFKLNKILPDDIAIFDIIPMEALQHARFDATERSYDYFIHTFKDPFLANLSAFYPAQDWDTANMQRAANLLLKYTDYRAFCKMPDRNDNTICTISEAIIYTDSNGGKLRFRISANRFLGRMVRMITGKLIQIGNGKTSVDEFEAHLIGPKLPQLIKPAYPQGLYLSKITYPYLDVPQHSEFAQMLSGNAIAWQKA